MSTSLPRMTCSGRRRISAAGCSASGLSTAQPRPKPGAAATRVDLEEARPTRCAGASRRKRPSASVSPRPSRTRGSPARPSRPPRARAAGRRRRPARPATACPPGRARGRRRSSGPGPAVDREGEARVRAGWPRLAGRLALPGLVLQSPASGSGTPRRWRRRRGAGRSARRASACGSAWISGPPGPGPRRGREGPAGGVSGREVDRGPGRGIAQEG